MWKIILRKTGEILAYGFATLQLADEWHSDWLDSQDFDEDNYPAVDFVKY